MECRNCRWWKRNAPYNWGTCHIPLPQWCHTDVPTIQPTESAIDCDGYEKEGSDGEWTSVNDRLPADNTPVLIVANGEIMIGAIEWEYPSWEETYQAFRYWDCPYNPGQDWEWYNITHWMPLPELPNKEDSDAG